MSREESRKRAGRPAQPGGPPVPDSVHRLPGWLAAVLVVGVVECGAGAVERAGYEVAVDLVGDLDAAVAEPAGHLGDRGAFGQGGGGVEVAQCVGGELRWHASSRGRSLEVFMLS